MGRFLGRITLSVLGVLLACSAGAAEAVFVDGGEAQGTRIEGKAWKQGEGYLECTGVNNFLFAGRSLGPGDFHVRATLSLTTFEHTAATFMLDGDHFGFDASDAQFFVQGPKYGKTRMVGDASAFITPGKPFDLEVRRAGKTLTILIEGKPAWETPYHEGHIDAFGFRPWRATMRLFAFSASGNVCDALPKSAMPDNFTLPTIDLSDAERRVVVAQGTKDVYQGHPTTLLMPDGKTMFAVWTYDHGGVCGPMKRSDDGGLTWSELIPVPENWSTVRNCPCIHRLTDPQGVARLFVFAGNGDMYQSISEDGGVTWTPMEANGLKTVVAPISVIPVQGGAKYLMWYQQNFERGKTTGTVWQSASTDGGLTWGETKMICDAYGANPCEPGVIKSPDGKQLLCLMRENARNLNSLMIVSDDEGETWSEARELPSSLTGDRHMMRYAPDGRLVCVFRDRARKSPTHGQFVGWVGTYEDIIAGREGQYRLLLLQHFGRKGDTGYPGLELLPDGTFVATTYGQYRPDERNSVVSIRFTMDEIDQKAASMPKETVLYSKGTPPYNNYRIPALITTPKGALLAFCEGREAGDAGDIDTLVRRSEDGGKTWSPQEVVWNDGRNTCGNPCPVIDAKTGVIWLLSTWNLGTDHEKDIIRLKSRDTRRVFVTNSEDDGKTWAAPKEITKDTKLENWTWYATGPCTGIQLEHGDHAGRLLIPCDHIEAETNKYFSHVIYSDDHGATWQLGGRTPADQVNECQAVELAGGRLMLNMRNYDRKQKTRAVATSDDSGMTWSPLRHDPVLIEPICQASLLRAPHDGEKGNDTTRLLFSNPASSDGRVGMTVRLSEDGGQTWAKSRLLHPGPSAYSCLAVLPDGGIACFYEKGRESAYETITFARFPFAWIEE